MQAVAVDLLRDLEIRLIQDLPGREDRLLDELARNYVEQRAYALAEAVRLLYDPLFLRLLPNAQVPVRAAVSELFSPLPALPPRTMRSLVHDQISVARPLLLRSPCLLDADLSEAGALLGQAHLRVIARRESLSPRVTDALIARGGRAVLNSLAINTGARFSDQGFETYLGRLANDFAVQQLLALRADLPTEQFRAVVNLASTNIRRLTARDGLEEAEILADQGVDLSVTQQTLSGALARVASIATDPEGLSEERIAEFVRRGERLELICALAAMTRLPLPVARQAIEEEEPGVIMLICRALNFRFRTVRAILRSLSRQPAPGDLADMQEEFLHMPQATALSAMRFMASHKRLRDAA